MNAMGSTCGGTGARDQRVKDRSAGSPQTRVLKKAAITQQWCPMCLGEVEALERVVEALDVAVGAEEADDALGVLVRLHTLEALDRIVQHHGRRRQLNIAVRLDHGCVPAGLGGPVHLEHVIAEFGAEAQPLHGRHWLGRRGLLYGQLAR